MTNYVTPQTWEECATHVEAGGIVEIEDAPGVWINDRAAATTYRGRCGTPDDGWAPRRLVPIETEATGAERYLAGRLDAPEYAEAYRKERGAIDVPDGYEAVWLPSETVDEFDAGEDDRVSRGHVVAGAREAQARRGTTPAPPPVPSWPDGVLRDAANRLRWIANSGYIEDPGIKRIIRGWADELDATLVPPWPGAVLSGLVDEEYRAAYEAAAPAAGDDEWCGAVLNDINSIIHQHCESDGSDDAHCDWVNDLANEVVRYFQRPDVLPQPAPSPVPPWPGAVLSGLCDEDGEPTWLAQAGQVRGEQVRLMAGSEMWMTCSRGWSAIRWVEVRAPRAVPGPETERVPWWEARDRLGLAGDPFVEVGSDDEGPWVRVVEGGTKLHSPVDPDGTVEVLK